MAAVSTPPLYRSPARDEFVMDTRTPSPSPVHNVFTNIDHDDTPDLSAEVAMLSTKLVNAINYQTNLDDALQETRHELDQARQRLAQLEAEKKRHDDMVANGVLVKKSDTDKIISRLRKDLIHEKAARIEAERLRKQTEAELENLTTALFEEANSMVAAARKDTEAVEKRNSQLKSELMDKDTIVNLQQEQLQELKANMERLDSDASVAARDLSIPSTPITGHQATFDASQPSPATPSFLDITPDHPLYFSHLIVPVLRNDTSAYIDFQDLLLLARRLGVHSRSNSSHGNSSSTGQSFYGSSSAIQSSPNLPGSFSFSSSPISHSGTSTAVVPPLKDSKFYKRVLTEDIEPTLRLDLAPGLSFLSRRTVIGALVQGTLSVEPYPQNKHYFACTLCGETRRQEPYVRKHKFRTSEDDQVPKPLCDYCLHRVRSCCDFVSFLRMVRDGLWKADCEEDQRAAWEESVRLRERMFWARLGGGVVPATSQCSRNPDAMANSLVGYKSSRQSLDSIPEGGAVKQPEGLKVHTGMDASEERPRSVFQTLMAMAMAHGGSVTLMPEGAQQKPLTPACLDEGVSPSTRVQTKLERNGAEVVEPGTPFEDAREQADEKSPVAAVPELRAQVIEVSIHPPSISETEIPHELAVQSEPVSGEPPSPIVEETRLSDETVLTSPSTIDVEADTETSQPSEETALSNSSTTDVEAATETSQSSDETALPNPSATDVEAASETSHSSTPDVSTDATTVKSARNSLEIQPRPQHQRQISSSSVLAKVRAMEAANQS